MPKGKKVVYVTKRAIGADAERDPSKEPHPSPYTDEQRRNLRGSALREEHDRAVTKRTEAKMFSDWDIQGPYSAPDLSSMSAQASVETTSVALDGWLDDAAKQRDDHSRGGKSRHEKAEKRRERRNNMILADYDEKVRERVNPRSIPAILEARYARKTRSYWRLSARQIKNIVKARKAETS